MQKIKVFLVALVAICGSVCLGQTSQQNFPSLGSNGVPSYFDQTNLNYILGNGVPSSIVIGSGTNNLCLGSGSCRSITTGKFNYCYGHGSCQFITTGTGNACLGDNCLGVATTTDIGPSPGGNFCLGDACLSNLTRGTQNTGIGSSSMLACTTCFGNNAQGSSALGSVIDGTYNDATGYSALANLRHNSFQNAVGYFSLSVCNNASDASNLCTANNAFGKATLQALIDGHDNTAVGDSAMGAEQHGNLSTAVGSSALTNQNNATGQNTAVGAFACSNVVAGLGNTCVGENAQVPASATQQAAIGRSSSIPTGVTVPWIQLGGQNEFAGADMFVSTAVGTAQSISGCSLSAASGGRSTGQFASGTTGTCTVTISLATAPHGWFCDGNDTNASHLAKLIQSGVSATQCVLTGTTTSGDVVTWMAQAY